jgi:hypothetical protein
MLLLPRKSRILPPCPNLKTVTYPNHLLLMLSPPATRRERNKSSPKIYANLAEGNQIDPTDTLVAKTTAGKKKLK